VNKKVDEETEFDEESPEEEVDDDYVEEVKRRTHSPSGPCVSSSDSDDDSPCESTASLDFDECIESDKPYEILAQGRSASNTATWCDGRELMARLEASRTRRGNQTKRRWRN
jgi:hypothetical protein